MLTTLFLLAGCSGASSGSEKYSGPELDIGAQEDTSATQQDTGVESPAPDSPAPEQVPSTEFRTPGSEPFTTETGTFSAADNCNLKWTRYQPTNVVGSHAVILSHGFMRNQNRMVGWAEHLSSWGIPVVTATLCHSSVFDVDTVQNARDMVALADDMNIGERLYMGHSNGGAVSIIASVIDEQAVAVLGLDPVDAEGAPAAEFLGLISVPTYALMGESSSCNDSASGISLFQSGPDHRILQVTESDHCDFESPSDWVCRTACNGSNQRFDDETLESTIRGLSTAFIAWSFGQDTTGERWWHEGGDIFDELDTAEAISPL